MYKETDKPKPGSVTYTLSKKDTLEFRKDTAGNAVLLHGTELANGVTVIVVNNGQADSASILHKTISEVAQRSNISIIEDPPPAREAI